MKDVLTAGDGAEVCVVGDGQEVCTVGKGREVIAFGLPGSGKTYNDLAIYTYNDLNMTFNQVDQTL